MIMNDYLAIQLQQHQIAITQAQHQQLTHYIKLLQQWNKTYNLIAEADEQHIVDRHIIDSLLVAPYLKGVRILDVGSGAGLPGIPLAILFPQYNFVLLDSNGKKTRFMTQAKVELGLSNVTVVQMRAENYHPSELFDTVLSRAFANIKDMLEYTHHLCDENGCFVALKGENVAQELAELPANYRCLRNERLQFINPEIHRGVVVICKEK